MDTGGDPFNHSAQDLQQWIEDLGMIEPLRTAQSGDGPIVYNYDTPIRPVDDQIGQAGTAPAPVQDILFGKDSRPTYAIIDAAKVEGLADRLSASGLPHRCLVQGDALRDLGDVVPWIVQLEDGHSLIRSFFTAGDAPWEFWSKDVGVFVRSPLSLRELTKHFRKFTRVRDENATWHYLRFWEPQICLDLVACLTPENRRNLFPPQIEIIAMMKDRLYVIKTEVSL